MWSLEAQGNGGKMVIQAIWELQVLAAQEIQVLAGQGVQVSVMLEVQPWAMVAAQAIQAWGAQEP